MNWTFEHPEWLWAALIGLGAAVGAARLFVAMSRSRAWSAAAARATLVLLLAAVLAVPSAIRKTDRLATVVVVDVSESVRAFSDEGEGAMLRRVREWLRAAGADRDEEDLLGLVVFDGASLAVAAPTASGAAEFEVDYRVREGTDIAGALRFAGALLPPDARRRVVLVSDGNATEGEPEAAARELAAKGTRIDIVPVRYRVPNEIMIEAVDAPSRLAREATAPVRVVIRSSKAATGRLDLLYEGVPLDLNGDGLGTARRVTLSGGRHVEIVEVPLREDRVIHRLEPVFTPDDRDADRIAANNRAQTFTVTPAGGRVLLVDGVTAAAEGGIGRQIADAIETSGLEVEVVGPQDVPRDPLTLQTYDLVILQDVPVEDVPRTRQQMLADYVERLGGGLLMVGGPDSFGAGGWQGTPIEPLLPVLLDIPDKVVQPTAAVALVLDSSGSMSRPVLGGARSQQQIANAAAAGAVRAMDERDLLSVISFNGTPSVVRPLSPNRDPDQAAQQILSIAPNGATNITRALGAAFEQLRDSPAPIKHVVLLSDGQDRMTETEGPPLAERMSRAGISVTTIAVGDGADTATLREMADRGNGEFYRVTDPNTLVRIFLREIRVIREPLIRKGRFAPEVLRSGSPVLAGLPMLPDLLGLVLTKGRDDPRVVDALATADGYPVLSHWYAGRGQVGAFTSDGHDWGREWLGTPTYTRFWTQLARQLSRAAGSSDTDLHMQFVGDELVIRMDAFDESGRPRDLLTVDGLLYDPSGSSVEIRLEQSGPGTYEARAPAGRRGSYVAALTPMKSGRSMPPVVGGATRAASEEYRRLNADVGLLREIADIGGGRELDLSPVSAGALFEREGIEPVTASTPMWPMLLAIAIGVFVLDVGTRRVAWDRLIERGPIVAGETQAATRTGRLRSAIGGLRRNAAGRGASGSSDRAVERGHAPVVDAGAAKRERAEARQAALRRLGGSAAPSEPRPDRTETEAERIAAKRRLLRERGGGGDRSGPGAS